MEQAMAYVCCPAEESRVKVQRYCRKIYELGYVPICPRFGFLPFLDEGEAEDQQAYNRMSHLILKRCRMVVVCGKEVTGTIDEIKDFMFVVTDENDTPYSFTFEEKPEGLENVSNGDTVTVRYTGTISEVDPFEGEVISVEKTQ